MGLNTGMGLVGGIPSDITIADNTFIDVHPRPHGATIGARAHNALGQDGVPPIERLIITGNTFLRSGGPAIELTGIQGARIVSNRFESPIRATSVARPNDRVERQPIVLNRCASVEAASNVLIDPDGYGIQEAPKRIKPERYLPREP
jgi:hypothetical protein